MGGKFYIKKNKLDSKIYNLSAAHVFFIDELTIGQLTQTDIIDTQGVSYRGATIEDNPCLIQVRACFIPLCDANSDSTHIHRSSMLHKTRGLQPERPGGRRNVKLECARSALKTSS